MDAWNVYAKKGNKTVFISIGSSKSALADLEIAEIIGCPLIVVPGTADGLTGWIEVAKCIKTHEPFESPTSDFSVGSDEKWIIPKNLRIIADSMPSWQAGTLPISERYCLHSVPFYEWVETQCASIGLSSEQTRIDIMKIDIRGGKERTLLYAMLDAGFRPFILLVNWSVSPDTDAPTKMTAGHLQNCGYTLIRKEGTKFLYMFVDEDMYSICSWENVNVINPFVEEIVNGVRDALAPKVIDASTK